VRPFATEHPFTTDLDISSVAFWRRPFEERDEVFAELRRDAPVSWQPPFEVPGQSNFIRGIKRLPVHVG
jgi:hypothetical protein